MKKSVLLLSLVLAFLVIPYAKAETGTIRIDGPEGKIWPVMLESPADFTIYVKKVANPTNEPNILLVMSEASWGGLSGNVVVNWTGDSIMFAKGEFTAATTNSDKVPPSDTYPMTTGVGYTVASLKDHLSYGLSVPLTSMDTIYWAMKPFLGGGPITETPQAFTVTLPSTQPRMLVYALGKIDESTVFNNRVPPTKPGFVVPEVAPVLLVVASLGALAVYMLKPKKYQ
jgi:hypothetical protein